jgi:hypothetical protein
VQQCSFLTVYLCISYSNPVPSRFVMAFL